MWRHFPSYQLERRADIFFSIYLADILFCKFGLQVESIIPEFPIRVGTICSSSNNKSFKADYFVKTKNSSRLILVELKTDDGSVREEQLEYLKRAKEVGLEKLLEGIREIYRATNSKDKYQYLLNNLHKMGLISLENNGEFKILPDHYEIEILHIMPNKSKKIENTITFQEIVEIVRQHNDELSLRFSESLLKWAETKAGEK